VFQRDAMLHLR